MDTRPAGTLVPLHTWTIISGHLIADVGCNRYGWFAEQEIWDLPIDNSVMMGCGAPLTTTTTSTTSTTTTSTTTTTTPISSCGNAILDPGKQCDPPGSPCGAFGQICDANCQCPVTTTTATTATTTTASTTTTTTSPLCGNGSFDPGEECDPPGANSTQCPSSPAGSFLTCTATCQCCSPSPEVCGNTTDDDCDGKIDCLDPDCASQPPCIRRDPTRIRFNVRPVGLDLFSSHDKVNADGVSITGKSMRT